MFQRGHMAVSKKEVYINLSTEFDNEIGVQKIIGICNDKIVDIKTIDFRARIRVSRS